MTYFFKTENGTIYGFATKKDALTFAYNDPRLNYQYACVNIFKDRGCKNVYCTLQKMGEINFYTGDKREWGKERPKIIDKSGRILDAWTKKQI